MAERATSGHDDKRRVLEATDIVRLIGEHVALRKQGREFKCLCPFHDDHNPSMYVVPAKQIYHCFVCGAGGDSLTFAIDYFKMSFREALQFLADRAGIKLAPPPRRTHDTNEPDVPGVSREVLMGGNKAAGEFFRAILGHAQHGEAARGLLERRGVSPAMIEQFQLGAAPDRWDGLLLTMTGKGLDTQAFLAGGLLKARETGGTYDALRHRLVFPIHDSLGRVIAFGGRKLRDEDEPKYLNSPETLLFNKSATLYGLPFASASIRAQNRVIVTEGYMDCIGCHQAGVINVVATLGTALTSQGARVLRRLCDTIVLLFDGDDAGQRAADRAVEILFAEPVDVKIATMSAANDPALRGDVPIAKDPDELLKQPRGSERFERMIEQSVDALDWWAARLKARTGSLALSARARAIDDEIARLVELGLRGIAPVRQQLIVRRIASLAGVDEATIRRALPAQPRRVAPGGASGQEDPNSAGASSSSTSRGTSGELLIACLLTDPGLVADLHDEDRAWLNGASAERSAAAGLLARLVLAATPGTPARDVLAGLEDRDGLTLAASLLADIERRTDGHHARLLETWRSVLDGARQRRLIQTAGQSGDATARLAILAQVQRAGGNRLAFPKISPR